MNTNVRSIWLMLVVSCALAACRFERSPAASPFAADAGPFDEDDGDGDRQPIDPTASGGAAAAGSGGAGGTHAAGTGGSTGPVASSGGTGGASPSAGGAAGAPLDEDASVIGESCDPDVLLCNPVTNEGCAPPMQCAVDAFSDVLSGYCIFNGPVADGCFNSGVTESCPPTETCLDFECRKLCFCDDDCAEGQCCVDPVGDLGFKACGAC